MITQNILRTHEGRKKKKKCDYSRSYQMPWTDQIAEIFPYVCTYFHLIYRWKLRTCFARMKENIVFFRRKKPICDCSRSYQMLWKDQKTGIFPYVRTCFELPSYISTMTSTHTKLRQKRKNVYFGHKTGRITVIWSPHFFALYPTNL